jgi:hypothetical protein
LDARRRIEELLKPEGEVIGVRTRPNGKIHRVVAVSPGEAARGIFEDLAGLGCEIPHEAPSRGAHPSRLIEIPGLGYVGYRESPIPTIDVNVSIERLGNVKFKFVSDSERESP